MTSNGGGAAALQSLPPLQVIPAVDVLGGEAVRLERGEFDRVTERRGDVLALAASYASAGASLIHLVDLDGARTGHLQPELVARVAAGVAPARLQASGGIRSPADAEVLLAAGADRIVVGTAAFAAPDALATFVAAVGASLVVALDVRAGRVEVAGWRRATGLTAAEAARRCADAGVPRLLCTAIDRDGMLGGPDVALLSEVREAAPGLPLLAAGGVRSRADLDVLAGVGCEGAVVGRALLTGRLPLSVLN
jgi:phosphoribosylformimino-5-aminoimidazole carboxamide ribotide isomerase